MVNLKNLWSVIISRGENQWFLKFFTTPHHLKILHKTLILAYEANRHAHEIIPFSSLSSRQHHKWISWYHLHYCYHYWFQSGVKKQSTFSGQIGHFIPPNSKWLINIVRISYNSQSQRSVFEKLVLLWFFSHYTPSTLLPKKNPTSHVFIKKFFVIIVVSHDYYAITFPGGGGGGGTSNKDRCTDRGFEYIGTEVNIPNNGPRNKVWMNKNWNILPIEKGS